MNTSRFYFICLVILISLNECVCQFGSITALDKLKHLQTLFYNDTFLLSSKHDCGETCQEGLGNLISLHGVQGCLILGVKRTPYYQEVTFGSVDSEKVVLKLIALEGSGFVLYTIRFTRRERNRAELFYYCCYNREYKQYAFGRCPDHSNAGFIFTNEHATAHRILVNGVNHCEKDFTYTSMPSQVTIADVILSSSIPNAAFPSCLMFDTDVLYAENKTHDNFKYSAYNNLILTGNHQLPSLNNGSIFIINIFLLLGVLILCLAFY